MPSARLSLGALFSGFIRPSRKPSKTPTWHPTFGRVLFTAMGCMRNLGRPYRGFRQGKRLHSPDTAVSIETRSGEAGPETVQLRIAMKPAAHVCAGLSMALLHFRQVTGEPVDV